MSHNAGGPISVAQVGAGVSGAPHESARQNVIAKKFWRKFFREYFA